MSAHLKAGSHWFSGPVEQPDGATSQSISLEAIKSANAASGTKLFDVVVSLHGDPQGDDDGSTQGSDPNSADQDAIERTLQFFADGVYESTEGVHKIRKVRIYRNSEKHGVADIRWDPLGHPKANLNGIGNPGRHIFHYDVFKDGAGTGVNHDLLKDPIGSGYTLAHEWGHYAYGLKDEYVTSTGDVPVSPSIMSSQWKACNAATQSLVDADWLNFSIAYQSDPPGQFQNTRKTAHHRKYGESCWETLARGNTLLERLGAFISPDPLRVVYPELAAVAPTGANTPRSPDLSGSSRSDLEIIWAADELVYEIVIDRSGSMSGVKIANALTAAKLLVDLAEEGSTIGVIGFSSSPGVVAPLTEVTDQASKDSIKSAIDGIFASGGTNIGSAAQSALNTLLASNSPEGTKVVFLLSDGVSSDNALAPIPGYQSAQIPIFTFSYGDDADSSVLGQMATATGGQLFVSPTSLAAVSQAFQDANAVASNAPSVASGSNTAPAGSESRSPMTVDSTLKAFNLTVTFPGSSSTATVELIDPNGTRLAPNKISQSGGETLLLFSIQNPSPGLWQIAATGNGGAVPFEFQVNGNSGGASFHLTSDVLNGERTLGFPEPFVINAHLTKSLPIINALVEAVVTGPGGAQVLVNLNDDGVAPDSVADDGSYAGIVDYVESGSYEVVVRAKGQASIASQSEQALELTAEVDSFESVNPDPPSPLGENFERFQRFQVIAQGVVPDDHADDLANATQFAADNIALIPGKIETGGDLDAFRISIPPGTAEIAIRISNLALGMNPVLKIYDAAGNFLFEDSLDTSVSQGGYLSSVVATSGNEVFFAEVSHADVAGTGFYQISAGPVLWVDASASEERAPRLLKENALRILLEVKQIAAFKDRGGIQQAIIHLRNGLSPSFWEDDFRLTKRGGAVFLEDKKAIRSLEFIRKTGNPPAYAEALADAVNCIVSASDGVCRTLIEDAKESNGNPKHIQKAESALESGRNEFVGGGYNRAVGEFQKARRHALLAVKKTPK